MPAPPDETPPDFDLAYIRRQVGGDEAFIEVLLQTFLEDAPDRVRAMRVAQRDDDPESIERAAHALKSTSGTIGAGRLLDACRQLERRVRTSPSPDAEFDRLVSQVEVTFEDVRVAVEAYLADDGA